MDESPKKKLQDEVALFRYGVLADLVHLAPGSKGVYARLREKAAIDYRIPGSFRSRVAPETIRDWLKDYRKGGFDALKPKLRSDVGLSRTIPQGVADLLLSIKENNRALSVNLVIDEARASGQVLDEVVLAPSTVHRLLSAHGLMRKEKPGAEADRRRFAFEKAGELWMSDVMHGPTVVVGRSRRKTYLIAFLDDATRVIPYAAFALSENTAAFLPVFKQAIERRGIPKRLFVDNGSAYRSHHLSLTCAKLGVTLIHARAYQPQSKGKQERWFRTVRMQLLPRLTEADLMSLDALNRRLWAYVEGEYHLAPHGGLDEETPLDRWAKVGDEVRYPERGMDLDDLFLAEAKRKVQKDRTASLDGRIYEVDAALVGASVTLRYDPSHPERAIQVWSGGRRASDAKLVDVHANAYVKRDRPLQLSKLDDDGDKGGR
jgi:transposase InsO family protein